MRYAFAMLLAACATDDPALLPADAVPLPLTLTADPFDPGTTVTLTVAGATPNAQVILGYSLDGADGGPCPSILGGLCLDLSGAIQELRRDRADASGQLRVRLPLPASPPIDRAWFQAVQLGATPAVSNVVDGTVRIDRDSDGLFDAVERDLGTDPARADTDGGGAADGAEVAAQTDPLTAGDDVLVGLGTVTVDLDIDVRFTGLFAGAACSFAGVCDCSASYGGGGDVVAIDGTTITFFGTWGQTASSCSSAVGLEGRVWEDPAGVGYHTFRLSGDGATLEAWLAHADPAATTPAADPFSAGQFVADPIGVAFTSPTTTFSGSVSESQSGVTATTFTVGSFTFGP